MAMMDHCSYGMLGGYDHPVARGYVDDYLVSQEFDQYGETAYGGMNERKDHEVAGFYGGRVGVAENYWDRHSCRDLTFDNSYGQVSHLGAAGISTGAGGDCIGHGLMQTQNLLSPTQNLLPPAQNLLSPAPQQLPPPPPPAIPECLSFDSCSAPMDSAATQFGYRDWPKEFPACPGQCYPAVHEAKKFPEVIDFVDKSVVNSAGFLPQSESFECPTVSSFPSSIDYASTCTGNAVMTQPICHNMTSSFKPNVMDENWRGDLVIDDDEGDDVESDTLYNSSKSNSLIEQIDNARNIQVSRVGFMNSGLKPSRKVPAGLHLPRKPMSAHSSRRKHMQSNQPFVDETEKKLWERDRKKKDNHNLIERKRRLNINDKIKELGTLLPSSFANISKDASQNKGSILKASVAYILNLQADLKRLRETEEKANNLKITNNHMKQKLKELEKFMRSTGLFEKFQSEFHNTSSSGFFPSTSDFIKEETDSTLKDSFYTAESTVDNGLQGRPARAS